MRTVGLAFIDAARTHTQGFYFGRFAVEIPPDLWCQAVAAEWPHGEGAVLRAVHRVAAAGYPFEGVFKPLVELNMDDARLLIVGPVEGA